MPTDNEENSKNPSTIRTNDESICNSTDCPLSFNTTRTNDESICNSMDCPLLFKNDNPPKALKDKDEELKNTKDENEKLQKALKEKYLELINTKDGNRKLQKALEDQEKELKNTKDGNRKLKKALEDKEKELKNTKDENEEPQKSLKDKDVELKNTNDENQKALGKKEKELRNTEDGIENLQKALEDKEKELKNTEDGIEKLKKALEDKYLELKYTIDGNRKLQKTLKDKNVELKNTKNDDEELQKALEDKEKELKNTKNGNEKFQKALEEKELKNTEDENNKLKMWGFIVMASLFAVVLLYCGCSLILKGHQLNHHELRVMLVGKTGAGKSASGNTILGEKVFRVESSPATVTETCLKKNKMVHKKNITVIDTPGVMDTWLMFNDTAHHAPDCISMYSPDPHIFLLVIRLGRLTVEERNAVKWIQDNFGEEALKFTMILFTGGDLLEGKPIENFISNSNELQNLVDTCGGRYHVFNNYDQTNPTQVTKLLEKIDTMINENMGYSHTKMIHQEVQQKTREEEEVKRAMMENQFRLEEKIKWKQLKDESISECNNIALQIRQEEEEKQKQLEENIKAEKSIELNEMAIKLRDEQYKNAQLTKEQNFWYNISFWCILLFVLFVIVVLCTCKPK